MRLKWQLGLVLGVLLTVALTAEAAVKPHALFSNNTVLQQGMKVPVWGTADPGEKVTVTFQGQTVSTTAENGKWIVVLNPLKAGGPLEMTIAGKNTIAIKNVLVGEVWVCSGQSNMAMQVIRTENAEQAIAESANPKIRLFTVPHAGADEPQRDVNGKWSECGPQTVGMFSAAGYFFGKDLQKKLDVPIGLINSSVGGTPAESWTSREMLASRPETKPILEGYARALQLYPEAQKRHEAAMAKWKAEAAAARKRGEKFAKRAPYEPMGPKNPKRPGGLYYAMISPLQPYAIRGAIWYQGEANAGRAWQYRTLFPLMIENWRTDWKQGDFPFLFVQLAPYMKITDQPADSNWAELRDAQLYTTQASQNTAMAVITDVGDENDIHPKKKQPVGERLALGALALAYGQKIEYFGPVYKSQEIKDGTAVLRFDHLGGGLVTKGDKLTGFTIAGADGKFVNAEAKIVGDMVVVSSPQVSTPVAVRFGWANYPLGNLWNKAGLPASPFRTDDFPLTTQGK
jgi:sialate O-acetylesterase